MNINGNWMNFAYMDNPRLYGSGITIQHLHYLPFGEDWVDQRNSSWNAPYTFSSKEKDLETGYGYFGARYYDSGLSIWLSVDPMSNKYPSLSPYNYCINNPLIVKDPNGKIAINVVASISCAIGYGVSDLISQTISSGLSNLINNKGFFSGWSKNIDWADVGVSVIQGGLDGATLGATKAWSGYAAEGVKSLVDQKNGRFSMVGGSFFGVNEKNYSVAISDFASGAATKSLGDFLGMNKLNYGNPYTKNWGKSFAASGTKTLFESPFIGVWSYGAQNSIGFGLRNWMQNPSASPGEATPTEIELKNGKRKLYRAGDDYYYYEKEY